MESLTNRMNASALFRAAAITVACVVAVWAGVVVTESPLLLFATLGVGAYVLTLTVNYRALAWLVVALQPAALIVPFLRGRPFFWEVAALLAWPSLAAFFLLNRRQFEALQFDRLERRALLALTGYVAVLFALMAVRGVGFRAFGGEQMGGRFYVQQVVLAIVPLLLIAAGLSRRGVLGAIASGWVLSLTYLISDFALNRGNPAIQWLLFFFEVPTDALNFGLGFELTGMRRYQSLAACGAAVLAATLTIAPIRWLLGIGSFVGVPLLLLGLLLGLGSGHRTVLIMWVSTFLLLTFLQRYWNPLRAMLAVVGGSVAIGSLYFLAANLPLSVQRAISVLPGIKVTAIARDDAWATLRDRLEVLALAWGDAPRYWLIGRGFGMERLDLIPPDPAHAGVWLQYVNGLFYNGTLGLFLKTGLPGLACAVLFVWWVSRMAMEIARAIRMRLPHEDGVFGRFCLLLVAQWFSTVAFFYLTHGDAGAWMQVFGLMAALIMACRRILRAEASAAPAADGG